VEASGEERLRGALRHGARLVDDPPLGVVEVMTLLAHGLSNAEIAKALVISEPTAKTHVAHILAKLNLRDRAQAIVLAYESKLVEPLQ
jgi:DNA-binding CsgD family transcriptional regulator